MIGLEAFAGAAYGSLAQQQSLNQMQQQGLFNGLSALGQGSMAALGNCAQPQRVEIHPGSYSLEHNVIHVPTKETQVNNGKEILPDISITRVLKWAVVVFIAMALGKKVWGTFGKQLTERLEGAVKELL